MVQGWRGKGSRMSRFIVITEPSTLQHRPSNARVLHEHRLRVARCQVLEGCITSVLALLVMLVITTQVGGLAGWQSV